MNNKDQNSIYLTDEEYKAARQKVYDELKYFFRTSRSVQEYKVRVKKFKKTVPTKSLMPYFDRIYQRFMKYLKEKELQDIRQKLQKKQGFDYSVREIFREASGLHKRGSAFEQGNYKCNTKLIYIAKKN